jgi:hypothetical protein
MSHIGIITAWNYAWSVLTACFVLGVAIFLLDRKFGIKIYRFLYDFFHKDPMPSDVDRGFLYNQSTNRGVTVAVFLSTVYSLYMVWELGFSMNFIAELIVWLLMPPALVGGFWAGRWVYRFLLRRSVYLDNLDEFGQKIEHIEVGEVASSIRKKGASFLSQFTPLRSATQVPKRPADLAAAETAPEEPKPDFRDKLKQYTRR